MVFNNQFRRTLLLLFFHSIYGLGQFVPEFENLKFAGLNVGNQNWSISKTYDEKVYIANSNGLLEYNGVDWSLYRLPNQTIIRSVLAVGDKVYTGSYEEFGFWKTNDFGELTYHSLILISKSKRKFYYN